MIKQMIKWSIDYWKMVELTRDSFAWWWYCITNGKYKE